eukprot:TRINITY_DN2895_c0_g1_i1.p1 TRINITY_DN2895_c0_g1~~TRINITY_DN2895_c0_g1_i1.p1  ORF type:complete len:1035 (+),score=342.85 TRINITY_DN2895_c0_g1_i1:50-3154(+)
MGCCEGKPEQEAGKKAGKEEIDDLRRQIGELTAIVQQQHQSQKQAQEQAEVPGVKALPADDGGAARGDAGPQMDGIYGDEEMVGDEHGINLLAEPFGGAAASSPASYVPPALIESVPGASMRQESSTASPPSLRTATDTASSQGRKPALSMPPAPRAPPPRADFSFTEKAYNYDTAVAGLGRVVDDNGHDRASCGHHHHERADVIQDRVRTIMVIGETGSGKSTLLNAMANWAAGVGYDTPVRYRLVHEAERSQAYSQTQTVETYRVACGKFSYTLRLIDTPGFGDTSGVERDGQITKDIYEFLQGEEEIHAVCFVAAASLPRLTVTQQYIINKVLTMFGADAVENVFLLITFADGKKAQVLNAIEASGFPYRADHSFHFNNSALYTHGGERNEYSKHFWSMGEASMNRFFEVLAGIRPFNLSKTKDVIATQKKLQNYVASITPQVSIGLSKIDNLRTILKDIKENKDKINENKNYTYTETIPKVTRQKKTPGMYNTQCLKCSYDCHHDCTRSNDADKRFCCAMDAKGHCTVCPGKCHWTEHANLDYFFEWTTQTVSRQYDTKKLQLAAAAQGLSRSEALKNSILEELQTVYDTVRGLMTSIHQAHATLDEIALRPSNLQFIDYLKLLIEQEKLHKRAGFEGRIEQLHLMLDQAKIQSDIVSNKFDPITDWKKNIEAELGGEGAQNSGGDDTTDIAEGEDEEEEEEEEEIDQGVDVEEMEAACKRTQPQLTVLSRDLLGNSQKTPTRKPLCIDDVMLEGYTASDVRYAATPPVTDDAPSPTATASSTFTPYSQAASRARPLEAVTPTPKRQLPKQRAAARPKATTPARADASPSAAGSPRTGRKTPRTPRGTDDVSTLLGLEYSDVEGGGGMALGELDDTPTASTPLRYHRQIATPSSRSHPSRRDVDDTDTDSDCETDTDTDEGGAPLDFYFQGAQHAVQIPTDEVYSLAAAGYAAPAPHRGVPLPAQNHDIHVTVRQPQQQQPTLGGFGIIPTAGVAAPRPAAAPVPRWASNLRTGGPCGGAGSSIPYSMVV